jgi:sec-independent protein translocase protein TatA
MVGDIFQPTHLLFVLVVALLVLGPKKLPEVGRQLGSGLRDFRAAINGERPEPEETHAPYEQPVPDAAAGHEFAHQPAAEATSNGHEFAHEPDTAADADAPHGETPDRGHEFAYETSESADKRTEPPV